MRRATHAVDFSRGGECLTQLTGKRYRTLPLVAV
jgi:hypothetical protein